MRPISSAPVRWCWSWADRPPGLWLSSVESVAFNPTVSRCSRRWSRLLAAGVRWAMCMGAALHGFGGAVEYSAHHGGVAGARAPRCATAIRGGGRDGASTFRGVLARGRGGGRGRHAGRACRGCLRAARRRLPLTTDTDMAHGGRRRIAGAPGALLLPPVTYGDAWSNEAYTGTVSLSPATLGAVMTISGAACVGWGRRGARRRQRPFRQSRADFASGRVRSSRVGSGLASRLPRHGGAGFAICDSAPAAPSLIMRTRSKRRSCWYSGRAAVDMAGLVGIPISPPILGIGPMQLRDFVARAGCSAIRAQPRHETEGRAFLVGMSQQRRPADQCVAGSAWRLERLWGTPADAQRCGGGGGRVAHHGVALSENRIELPPSTPARIDAAIAQLDYRPNLSAKRLSTGQDRGDRPRDARDRQSVLRRTGRAFEDEARLHGLYGVHAEVDRRDPRREIASLRRLPTAHVDGLVLMTNTPDDGTLAQADRPAQECRAARRGHSGRQRAPPLRREHRGRASRHAPPDRGRAHQRSPISAARAGCSRSSSGTKGFAAPWPRPACRSAPNMCRSAASSPELARASALKFLALPDPPTAIFASSDYLAIGAVMGLRDAGISVPDQMSLIGFDDMPFGALLHAAAHRHPPAGRADRPRRLPAAAAAAQRRDAAAAHPAAGRTHSPPVGRRPQNEGPLNGETPRPDRRRILDRPFDPPEGLRQLHHHRICRRRALAEATRSKRGGWDVDLPARPCRRPRLSR